MGSASRPEIFLASSSPRRKELLRLLGLSFRILAPPDEEARRPAEKPRAYAMRVARRKARWAAAHPAVTRAPAAILIAADTIVCLGHRVLVKPAHRRQAAAMLRALSGRQHAVITALCVRGRRGLRGHWIERCRIVSTRVVFKRLRRPEIAAYVRSGEPMDKAGAYALQGRAGYMVRRVNGSCSNVVGLPLTELHEILARSFHVPVGRAS